MIQPKRINGIDIKYSVIDPKIDDVYAAFKLGSTIKEFGQTEDADLAMNFNYADTVTGTPIGRLIVDGAEVIHDIPKTVSRDELYMLPDRSVHIGKAPADAIWAMQGSPPLLRNGKNVIDESIVRDQLAKDIWNGANYRVAGGITWNYKLIIVRTLSKITLHELAAVMLELGCVDALNGDGGGSCYLWPYDSGWGRKLGSALVVKKGEDHVLKLIGDLNPEVVIDPGHGGTDPGASKNGIIEKLLTLAASLYMFERFGELGIKRALTRDTDITIEPAQRTKLIRDSKAKYCISNHINAGGGDGAETIHSIFANSNLATSIANEIVKAGQNLRRVFTRKNSRDTDYYYMHRDTGAVHTVIVEYFFLDSIASGPNSDINEYKEEFMDWVEGAVKGYCLHTGRKYSPPKIEELKPVVVKSTTIEVHPALVKVKGKQSEAFNHKGTVYVPVRFVSEAHGSAVSWDATTSTVTIKPKGGE